MIGNDIVDLKNISNKTNWKRPGFLERVFTENEQDYISKALDQSLMVWQLWSMKEAAYKAYVRELGNRFFNPKRIHCTLISEEKGEVNIDNSRYFSSSNLNKEYIYTVATKQQDSKTRSSVLKLLNDDYYHQNIMLQEHLLNYISRSKHISKNNLKLVKSTIGVPSIFRSHEIIPMQLSLSHCGYYAAFSVLNG